MARSQGVALEDKLHQENASRQALVAEFDGLRNEIRIQRAHLEDVEKRRARELEAARSEIVALESSLRQERFAKETLSTQLQEFGELAAARQQERLPPAQAQKRVEPLGQQVAVLTPDSPVVGAELATTQSSPRPESTANASTDPVGAQLSPVPAAGTPAPAESAAFSWAPGADAFVRAWANAWSRQAVDDYLEHYSADFRPANGASRAAWEAQRRKRLRRPSFIEVKVSDMEIESLDANRARATFRQSYRADGYQDVVVKVLELARDGGRWWIVDELSR